MRNKFALLSPVVMLTYFTLFTGLIRNDVPIIEYLNFAKQPAFDCVGTIGHDDKIFGGSCVLIASKFVLTAAHLSLFDGKKGLYCEFNHIKYKIKSFKRHPGFNKKEGYHLDFTIVELEEEIKGVTPASLNEGLDELGKKGAIIGYGTFGIAGMLPTPRMVEQKVGGMNMIDSLFDYDPEKGQFALLAVDFDKPGGDRCCNSIRSGSSKPLRLEFLVNGGDSGGGMFIKKKGKWYLAGITHTTFNLSAKNGYGYGMQAAWARVAVYKDWIKQSMLNWDNEKE